MPPLDCKESPSPPRSTENIWSKNYGLLFGRHATIVNRAGFLISMNAPLEVIRYRAHTWNQEFSSPLPEYEVNRQVNSCWKRWAEPDIFESVPEEGRKLSYAIKAISDRSLALIAYEGHHEQNTTLHDEIQPPSFTVPTGSSPKEENSWQTEPNFIPQYKQRRKGIFENSDTVLCIRYHAHNWREEGGYYKQRWVNHLLKEVQGQPLYMMEVLETDWNRARQWDIGKDYIRINQGDGRLIVLTTKALSSLALSSSALIENLTTDLLDSIIPDKADHKAVSTSRSWKLPTKEPGEKYNHVVNTSTTLQDISATASSFRMGKKSPICWKKPREGLDTQKFKAVIEAKEERMRQKISQSPDPEAAAKHLYAIGDDLYLEVYRERHSSGKKEFLEVLT